MASTLVTTQPTSRYKNTPFVSNQVNYLDFWVYKNISISANDSLVQLESKYNLKPHLFSYDLYGTPDLWWIFMVINPNVIKDPIYDFKTGIYLYVPSNQTLSTYF